MHAGRTPSRLMNVKDSIGRRRTAIDYDSVDSRRRSPAVNYALSAMTGFMLKIWFFNNKCISRLPGTVDCSHQFFS